MFKSKQLTIALAGVFVVLSACMAGTVWAEDARTIPGPPVGIAKGKFETAREKGLTRAYRMKQGYQGDEQAKQLAERLNRHTKSGDLVELKPDSSNGMMYVSKGDPSGHFRVNKKTGDFSFSKGMKGYFEDGSTPGLPDKEQAAGVAKKHLKDLGLMPAKQEELVLQHIGGLKQVELKEDGKQVESDKLVTVHFGRQIDGSPVGGPGSKMIVHLGADGELVGLHRRWVEVSPERRGDQDFKGQGDVHRSMTAQLKQEAARAKRAEASAPALGLFDDGEGNIEPAYFFEADLEYDSADGDKEGGGKFKEKYLGVVGAIKGSKANFRQLERAKGQPEKADKGRKPEEHEDD